jgi:hypothetical protein
MDAIEIDRFQAPRIPNMQDVMDGAKRVLTHPITKLAVGVIAASAVCAVVTTYVAYQTDNLEFVASLMSQTREEITHRFGRVIEDVYKLALRPIWSGRHYHQQATLRLSR